MTDNPAPQSSQSPKRKRKAIPNKLRFDVFKRDSFKCQYCGRTAPDVTLACDHIVPVASGGATTLLNLITSCFECNSGKGATPLSDSQVVEKSRKQAEELQQRREQIKMMAEWHASLADSRDDEARAVAGLFHKLARFTVTETGIANIKKWLKTFTVDELMTAVRLSCENYLELEDENNTASVTRDSAGIAFDKIPGVARMSQIDKEDPTLRDLYYIRGILRNRHERSTDVINRFAIPACREALKKGWTVTQLKAAAIASSSFYAFEQEVAQ